MSIRQATKGFFKGFKSGYSKGAATRIEKERLENMAQEEQQKVAAQKKNEFAGIVYLILLGVIVAGVYGLWNIAGENGYIPHTEIAIVTAKNWSIGEYKICTSANLAQMKDEPQIDCSSFGEYGESKRFEVRFYGATYREDLSNVSFTWRCTKNDGTDPTFTCDEQKIMKWDKK